MDFEVGSGQSYSPNFTDNDFDNHLNYLILNNCFNGFYFKWAAVDCQQGGNFNIVTGRKSL